MPHPLQAINTVSSQGRRDRKAKSTKHCVKPPFIKTLIPLTTEESSWPNLFLNAPPLNTMALGIKFLHEFWRRQKHSNNSSLLSLWLRKKLAVQWPLACRACGQHLLPWRGEEGRCHGWHSFCPLRLLFTVLIFPLVRPKAKSWPQSAEQWKEVSPDGFEDPSGMSIIGKCSKLGFGPFQRISYLLHISFLRAALSATLPHL